MSDERPEQKSSRAWRYVCLAFAMPALVLPLLSLVFRGHGAAATTFLEGALLLAAFVSGPGGIVALIWEFNFPYSPDWGYLLAMALSAGVQWTAIWWVGEHWKIRGRAVRWWLLAGVMILFLASMFFKIMHFIATHS